MGQPKYYLGLNSRFVIENYNASAPFSSFFPGIAGPFGCPMWVFYANRGQCITSAGVENKDHSIIEFQPANKAYRFTPTSGFRTFIKVEGRYYEPFTENSNHQSRMEISPDHLTISEENNQLKIKVEITYYTLPGEDFPALARMLKIYNLSGTAKKIELIDGLPVIIPFGFGDDALKKISLTTAAWCRVENLENQAPFYRLKAAPVDSSETKIIERGNFYLSFASKEKPICIIDKKSVFAECVSLISPLGFLRSRSFTPPKKQCGEGYIPAALSYCRFTLAGKEEFGLNSLFGEAKNMEAMSEIKQKASHPGYFEEKLKENQLLINGICANLSGETASRDFDLYAKQTFLDNVMRGGLPVSFGAKSLYLYYRKHGDMERDYNNFQLMPTYLSQGNGNYRDINQNRRNDIFFNLHSGEENIIGFFNLIQLDGFNPLVVLPSQWVFISEKDAKSFVSRHYSSPRPKLAEKLVKPFYPGKIAMENGGHKEAFIADLLASASRQDDAVHVEGYWIDHPYYNTDLLESFEALYPEKISDLLFNRKVFTFFDSQYRVASRAQKYCLTSSGIRQRGSVISDPDKKPGIAKTAAGEVYRATLAAKIICLVANKAASFDAQGIGLEMEAEKPDWYDALNGLPSLFGSSLSETLELKRLAGYLLARLGNDISFFLAEEIFQFIGRIDRPELFGHAYWEAAAEAKEDYREAVRMGVAGKEIELSGSAARQFLQGVISRCDRGIRLCRKRYKTYPTYFINEAVEWEKIDNLRVKVNKFAQKPLPLFLEGFVHALKVEKDPNIPRMVKNSPLYDRKLKMYKVNAPLSAAPIEIGRAKIFTPGWLENESIWLHMEYKYLLELLRGGFYEEFFADMKNCLVPFLDPKKYGRSILENSSFIVSSAHPNPSYHGRGFYARLSGSTAEFIDIWLFMMTGKKLFFLDEKGSLCFKLSPILPAWLFKKGKVSFALFGSIETTYLNPKRKSTFGGGVKVAAYKLILDDGKEVSIDQPIIKEPYASLIRERKVKRIIAILD